MPGRVQIRGRRISLRSQYPGKLYCWHIFKNSRSSLSRRSTGTKRSANGHRECNFYAALAAFYRAPPKPEDISRFPWDDRNGTSERLSGVLC